MLSEIQQEIATLESYGILNPDVMKKIKEARTGLCFRLLQKKLLYDITSHEHLKDAMKCLKNIELYLRHSDSNKSRECRKRRMSLKEKQEERKRRRDSK